MLFLRCESCGAPSGPMYLVGKQVKRRPPRDHVCQGPNRDPAEEARLILEELDRWLDAWEKAALVKRLRG